MGRLATLSITFGTKLSGTNFLGFRIGTKLTIEFSVLIRQCLNRRIPDVPMLCQEISAWEKERNTNAVRVNWQFTTEDARITLRKLYPSFDD